MFKKSILTLMIGIFFILTLSLNFVNAVPPVTTTQQFTEGFNIQIPQDNILKVGDPYIFEFHVNNISNGFPIISGIVCYLHIYNTTGGHQYAGFDTTPSLTFDYEFVVNSENFTKTGSYYYYTQCNNSNLGGFAESILRVTQNGEETSMAGAIFYIGLLSILVIFLIGAIIIFMESNNLLAKVGMLGLSYLMLLAITFIGWNMAKDFLTSAPFLIAILRILFLTLMIIALPLLIGAFVWYFLMLWKIKEIEGLMGKGMSQDEAERRQGSKFKRGGY